MRGSWRADTRPAEPAYPSVHLVVEPLTRENARKFLEDAARAMWGAGVTGPADQLAFALLVDAVETYVAAREFIAESGIVEGRKLTMTTTNGNLIQHPAVGILNKSWERILKACREFGMTPASRTGIPALPLPTMMRPVECEVEKNPLTT